MTNKIPVSRSEYEIIRRAAERNFRKGSLSEAERILEMPRSTLESVFRLLADRGLVSIIGEEQKTYTLTDKGREAL
ncbi:MAG: phenylalanyl-tRNA synthetase subunit alpha, partial [Desulfurococcales archaeon]|nr:phenylalanyl-tRNA synthetase subunit alpha [Desulfurococcales archaeon]